MPEDFPNQMTKEEAEEFDFWSDQMSSLRYGELPLSDPLPKDFSVRLAEVLKYASEKHRAQARKGTRVPYICHPMAVASLVFEMGGTPEQVHAALLHDVVEDTNTPIEEITELFGEVVSAIVKDCSNALTAEQKLLPTEERKDFTVSKIATLPLASIPVFLGDKLHNLRSIVRDLAIEGDEVWSKFRSTPGQVQNYYLNLAKEFEKRKAELNPVQGYYIDELMRSAKLIKTNPELIKTTPGR